MSNGVSLLATWLIVVNMISLLIFGWDKLCARAKWRRIPETTLLTLALIGGSVGARIGQKLFRHKTSKQPFARKLSAIVILHGICFIFLCAAALSGLIPT